MNPEEMRIAVAEVMGWNPDPFGYYTKDPAGLSGPRFRFDELPNYPASLDACAEFEAGMTDEEFEKYVETLSNMVESDMDDDVKIIRKLIFATPSQRCEAFLRVKGVIK